VVEDERNTPAVSRRAFLKGGALATGALSTTLLPTAPAEAQLPDATTLDDRRSTVEMRANGVAYRVQVRNNTTLLEVLRAEMKLTGAKMGCDRAMCGACTVIVNGRTIYACTALAVDMGGAEITTIEGLATGDRLHPIQQGFVQESGYQCGFCTSGQIMSAKALLDRVPQPTEDQIRTALSGNLCRCAAYKKIVQSVMTASRLLQA
jgi:aerobic-type carbon monoxide dehydrogenase small subunit (CoxS/CutS family)